MSLYTCRILADCLVLAQWYLELPPRVQAALRYWTLALPTTVFPTLVFWMLMRILGSLSSARQILLFSDSDLVVRIGFLTLTLVPMLGMLLTLWKQV